MCLKSLSINVLKLNVKQNTITEGIHNGPYTYNRWEKINLQIPTHPVVGRPKEQL